MKDVKLIATDMDHTLLTEKGELPPNFEKTINDLNKLDIAFAIASGRGLFTLKSIFSTLYPKMILIADNGASIYYKGEVIFKSLIEPAIYLKMVSFVEENSDGIPMLCGLDSAYIRKDQEFRKDFLHNFYTELKFVDSFENITSDINKFTVFCPDGDSHANYENIFKPAFEKDFSITVGDKIWVDVMNKNIDKGSAMQVLGEKLNISPSEMMAFGDTYNDIPMLKFVKYSYIMANATTGMEEYANYRAKSNDEYGVIQVIQEIINQNK